MICNRIGWHARLSFEQCSKPVVVDSDMGLDYPTLNSSGHWRHDLISVQNRIDVVHLYWLNKINPQLMPALFFVSWSFTTPRKEERRCPLGKKLGFHSLSLQSKRLQMQSLVCRQAHEATFDPELWRDGRPATSANSWRLERGK